MLKEVGAALVLVILWSAASNAAEPQQAFPVAAPVVAGGTVVEYDGEKDALTVDAKAVPLGQLLKAIGKKSNIEVKMIQEADRPVTIKFTGMSAEMGLRFIGEETSMNYGLFFSKGAAADGETQRRVSALWVMAPGKAGASPAVSSPVAAAVEPRPAPPTPASTAGLTSNPALPNPAAVDETALKSAARERLERRLSNLPPAERERVIKADEERNKRREERMLNLSKAREERRKTIMNESEQGGQ